MFVFLILFIIVLLLIYIKLKYFTLRGPIPGIPPQFLLGNLFQTGFIRGISYAEIYKKLRERFGDICQLWLGPSRFILVSNIVDVQYIFSNRNIYDQGDLFVEKLSNIVPDSLITIKGAKFKRHGAVTMPLFRRAKVISNFDLIIDCVDKLLDRWRVQSKDHIHTDIVQQSQNLLLLIFGFIAFDFDLETLNDYDHKKGRNELNQAFEDTLNTINIAFFSPKFISKIYLTLSPRYRQARSIIQKYVYQMVEQELKESDESRAHRKRTSLIASLVASLQSDEKFEATKREEDKKGLSRTEILNEVLMFLAAGFETTSTALSWFIYAMSKNPRVQQKLKTELRDEDGRYNLSANRIDSLIYLDCVINEVLRYHTTVTGTTRTLTTDDRLPETGIQLYKGEEVIIPICTFSKDPQLWSIDPEQFYPERFLNEDKNHHILALIPFGYGHRQCVGQDLARFELKVIAARLMQYVTFSDGGPELNAGGFITGLTIKPKKIGVTIEFDRDE